MSHLETDAVHSKYAIMNATYEWIRVVLWRPRIFGIIQIDGTVWHSSKHSHADSASTLIALVPTVLGSCITTISHKQKLVKLLHLWTVNAKGKQNTKGNYPLNSLAIRNQSKLKRHISAFEGNELINSAWWK